MAALLESPPVVEVVGQAATEDEAVAVVAALARRRADGPRPGGWLRGRGDPRDPAPSPRSECSWSPCSVTTKRCSRSIRAGARGYLLKGASPGRGRARGPRRRRRGRDARPAGRAAGRSTTSPAHAVRGRGVRRAHRTASATSSNSSRRGHDNATIARTLVLTSKTVRNYVYAIFDQARRHRPGRTGGQGSRRRSGRGRVGQTDLLKVTARQPGPRRPGRPRARVPPADVVAPTTLAGRGTHAVLSRGSDT